MNSEVVALLERLSGKKTRPYSTFDFGRTKDSSCLSVVVPEDRARARKSVAERAECLEAAEQVFPAGDVQFRRTLAGEGPDDLDLRHAVLTGQLQRHLPGVLLDRYP